MKKKSRVSKNNDTSLDKIVLMSVLLDREKSESSNFARLLFQENILQLSIIATLKTIELWFDRCAHSTIRRLHFDYGDIERKTLGPIAGTISPFLSADKQLIIDLNKFISLRNNITHKLLHQYRQWREIEKDAAEVVLIGSSVITRIADFKGTLIQDILKNTTS